MTKNERCASCGYENVGNVPLKDGSCPACGILWSAAVNDELKDVVHKDEAGGDEKGTLRLQKEPGAAMGQRTCPVCNAAALPGDTRCKTCNYDWIEGKVIKVSGGDVVSRWLMVILMAVVVVFLALIFFLLRSNRNENVAPDGIPAEIEESANAELMTGGTHADTNLSPEILTDVELVLVSREELQNYRDELSASLETKYPKFNIGDRISLKHKTGQISRGELLGISDEEVVLRNEDKTTFRVELSGLRKESLLRVSDEARGLALEARLNKVLTDQGLRAE